MATIAEIDERIEKGKRQIAQLEERKKAMLAKEREQARKWRAAVLSAVGETVLAASGADWTDLDLDALRGWLSERSDDLASRAVRGQRTPAEAKAALDAFRKAPRKKEEDAEPPAPAETSPAPDRAQPWTPDMTQQQW